MCIPLVILSPREFNERTGIAIGLPMSTATFNDSNPFAVKFKGPRAWPITSSAISQNHSTGEQEMRSRIP